MLSTYFNKLQLVIFAGANPIWNPDETADEPKLNGKINPLFKDPGRKGDDSDSGSGDSVFIGVEDQDDFRGYKERYEENVCQLILQQSSGIIYSFLGIFI